MKLLTLIYDESLDAQVTAIFQRDMAVTRYSKIEGVAGARMDALSNSDYVTDRRNSLILAVTDERTMARLVADLRALRDRLGHGVRGVVTQADEVI